jgi:acyl-CoA synthetase (NDP forming)/RimJ/RimL family protein N-acetyltransferase
VRDVVLRDGAALRLRSPRLEDEADIKAFFDALAPESRYLRFHGLVRTDLVARDYAHADGDARMSLLAHLDGRVVAVAGYDRLNEPGAAEVAFAVADEMHGRGLATRMLEQLAEIAAERGIMRFNAEVMAGNHAMLGVFAGVGFDTRRVTEFGEVHLALDLRPTERYEERRADRTHVAAVASLRHLLAPRSVAVIGASGRRDSVGGAIYRGIVAGGFAGIAVPVHPDGGVVASARAVRSLDELDEAPELAVVAVPAGEVLGVAREAARCGVSALLVVSAGFSDTDEPEGRAREEALLEVVREHGMRLVGPNALGVVNTDPEVALHAFIGRVAVRPGGLALSSQSGALGLALLGHAAARGLGISSFVALGNRTDVSTNDLLEHLADDQRTSVVALYVESFGNPRRFSQVSRRVSRRKPIIVVKGAHGHALGETATDALFRQAGVLRVEHTQTLFDAAELLERQPLPGGRGLAVVTNSGGLGVVAADACAASGLELAVPGEETRARLAAALPGADHLDNPIDLGLRAPVADDVEAVTALVGEKRVDAVLVLHVELGGDDPSVRLQALDRIAESAAKTIVACVVGADGEVPRRAEWRVPNYRFPEAAVRALALAADRREWLSRPLGQAPVVEGLDLEAARAVASRAGDGPLDDAQARALLRAVGIEPVSGVRVRMVADPNLGPLIGVGTGGERPRASHASRAADLTYRLAPLTDVDAGELAGDAHALRDVVVRLAALAEAVPELAEVELDPVQITLGLAPQRERAETW